MQKTWEVWNSLLGKSSSSMTEAECHVNRVNIFVVDFENGSWLYNISPGEGEGRIWSKLRELGSSVRVIGSPRVATYLDEILEIVEQTDIQIPGTWGDYLENSDPENRIAALHELIRNELPSVWGKLNEYTIAHFACEV